MWKESQSGAPWKPTEERMSKREESVLSSPADGSNRMRRKVIRRSISRSLLTLTRE